MTNGITDPAEHWSDLLSNLTGRRREAVVAALRSSAQQGWPADREAVRLLVAYANGEIDAQDYAVGIVISLGGHEGMVQAQEQAPPPPVEPQWTPRPVEPQWKAPSQPAAPVAPAPPVASVSSIAPQPALTREEAVAAYVSGRIPVEEFLRITRGVSA
jgi:hypothetical protein